MMVLVNSVVGPLSNFDTSASSSWEVREESGIERLLDDSVRETELWRLEVALFLFGSARIGRKGSVAFLSTADGTEDVGEGRESRLGECTLAGRLVSILSNL